MKREPILTAGMVSSGLTAVVGLLVAFGVHLSDGQTRAIIACAPVVAAAGTWVLGRMRTTPIIPAADYQPRHSPVG